MRRNIALSLAVVVAALIGGAALVRPGSQPTLTIDGTPRPLPRQQLAPVDAATFDGIVVGLRGKPIVVNVWASWCGPCRVEAPLLDRASRAYGADVTFVGVASKDALGDAEAFLDRYDISYTNLFDRDGSVRRRLGLRGFPTTYVFDREGALVATEVGGVSEQRLAAQLDDVLRT